MLFLSHKHFIVLSFLIIINLAQFEAETPMDLDFDQSLLPFGSKPANRGRFLGRCIENDDGATFTVRNNCPFTVWAAAIPSASQRLESAQIWNLKLPFGSTGRIWGRTNCTFDSSGRGNCETGDCGGVFQCHGMGTPPNTLLNFALNQYNKQDFLSVSLVYGFNIPIEIVPISDGCNWRIGCAADVNAHCPAELRTPGGCNNPCTVFGTARYCCNNSSADCEPTSFSKFFKTMCPDVYTYPNDDDESNKFTCLGKTNYDVVFCPSIINYD